MVTAKTIKTKIELTVDVFIKPGGVPAEKRTGSSSDSFQANSISCRNRQNHIKSVTSMNSKHDIYVIRSAASPINEPGRAGEELRTVADDGQREIHRVGSRLNQVIDQPIHEVRFAPANRTRRTALGIIGLTYSSVPLQRDEQLTNTDPDHLKQYLEEISDGPTILFTHLDVIQSMVEAVRSRRPTDAEIATASLTKFERSDTGLEVNYIGKTIDQAIKHVN